MTTYLVEDEFALLAALPASPLVKRRYPFDLEQGEMGIDVFEGRLLGLETAEIELGDDATLRAFLPPEWAVADVSDDPQFQGARLADLAFSDAAAMIARLIDRCTS